jgi:O-antigen ligase
VPRAARSAVAPLYLLACLILGGSAQGILQNMILQLAGLAIIAWSTMARSDEPMSAPARLLFFLVIAAIAVVALQQLPLPPTLWAQGSRTRLADSFRLLGQPVPWESISLTPFESLSSLLCIIPPLAMLCAIVRLKAFRPGLLAFALLGGTLGGIMLGALQVSSAGPDFRFYPYAETNFGSGVGFFANANHMASLLLVALPFVAAIAAAGNDRNIQRNWAILSVSSGLALILIVGIALNGSLAGFALAVPVLASSALIILPPVGRIRIGFALLAAFSVIAALAALAGTSIGGRLGQDTNTAVQSRETILVATGKAIADHMPLGTGLGSFVRVYRLYERPGTVTSEYVIHAHNDYAELTLEMGVPGIILLLLFLAWWVVAVHAVWRKGEGGPFARAASIASAVLLAHSLVDFPLRTAAMSTAFAMCVGLLADRRVSPNEDAGDLRPARHLVIR